MNTKKIRAIFFGLIGIAQSIVSTCFASCCQTNSCCSDPCYGFDVFVPNIDSGFEITGAVVFLQPLAQNLGWGVITDFLPFITPNWNIKQINPDHQPGLYLGARYIFCESGMDIQADWTRLRTSDSQSATVTPILQWISPFCQTGPGTADTEYDPTGVGELTTAKAKVKFHFDTVNLDLGIFVNFGCNMQMRVFTGLSGVKINERLTSTFEGVPPPPTITLKNNYSYWGIGPRLGLLTSYAFCDCFHFAGKLAAALLFGKMEPAQYLFEGSSEALALVGISVNRESISSKSVSQAVAAIDARLGLNYAFHFCECYVLTLEAGYLGAIYMDPLNGYETNENVLPLELGSLSTGSMKHIQSNFSVNGPYASLSFKF